MRNRLYLSLGVVALFCLVAWTAPTQLQRTGPAGQTWEYAIVLEGATDTPVNQLNKSGAQGWELVSVVCTDHA